MTTKRKAILKAIALAGSATMDDLCLSTGIERKNAHDNVKATMKEDLIERIRDDVTGQPAYKLTPKGRQWLEDDKDDSRSEKPQAQVGKNSASKDTGSIVDSSGIGADPLPVGNAVSAPPKPDKKPVAACADDLHKRIEQLEQDVSKQRVLLDAKREEIDRLNDDIRRQLQRAEAAERNRDDTQKLSEDNRRLFLAAISDLASVNRALDLDPNDGGAEPILSAIEEISATLREESAEKDRLQAENLALKTLNESMPGFGAAHEAQQAKKPAQPRRPFSVTGLAGYHAGGDKVTLFLDRRLNARSVTLPADKLVQLAEMAGAQ